VFLLSLRTQLQATTGSKPAVAAALLPDPAVEGTRCCGALWLPHTNGHFIAAYTGGTINVYKKVGQRAAALGAVRGSLGTSCT